MSNPIVPDLKDSQYLAFLAGVISDNSHPELASLRKPGKPFTKKDFDKLTPEQFHKLLIFLLTDLNLNTVREFSIQKEIRTLPGINDLGVFPTNGHITYDASFDHLFWSVKKYYPEYDDSFNYSMILFKKPKGIKSVLSYLSYLAIFFDNIRERFETAFDQVAQDSQERITIFNEVEELKTFINQRAIQNEEWVEEVPQIEAEIIFEQREIQESQAELEKLEEEYKLAKKLYDDEEGEVREVERNISYIEKKIQDIDDSLVSSPAQIYHDQSVEKGTLGALKNEREHLGKTLNDAVERESDLRSLYEDANHTIKIIADIIKDMEETSKTLDSLHNMKQENTNVKKELSIQDSVSKSLSQNNAKSSQNIIAKLEACEKNKEMLAELIAERKMMKEELDKSGTELKENNQRMNFEIEKVVKKIKLARENNDRYEKQLKKFIAELQRLFAQVEEYSHEYKVYAKRG